MVDHSSVRWCVITFEMDDSIPGIKSVLGEGLSQQDPNGCNKDDAAGGVVASGVQPW